MRARSTQQDTGSSSTDEEGSELDVSGGATSSSGMTGEEWHILRRISGKLNNDIVQVRQVTKLPGGPTVQTVFVCDVLVDEQHPPIELIIVHTVDGADTRFSASASSNGRIDIRWFQDSLDGLLADSGRTPVTLSSILMRCKEVVDQYRMTSLIETLRVDPPAEEDDGGSEAGSVPSSGTTAASRRSSQSTTPSVSSHDGDH